MYLRRYHDLQIGHSTIYRILKRLGISRPPASQRYRRHQQRWWCATTGGTTVTRAFESTDRPTTGYGYGYGYGELGRTLTLPAADAPRPADGNVTIAYYYYYYYDDDQAKSISQGGVTTSFTLDAADRRSAGSVVEGSEFSTTTRHYTDTSDNPTWVSAGSSVRRYVELMGDDVSLMVDENGAGALSVTNPHDDVVSTVDLTTCCGR